MTKALTRIHIQKYIHNIHLEGKGGRAERSVETEFGGDAVQGGALYHQFRMIVLLDLS